MSGREELLALSAKATPGPWNVPDGNPNCINGGKNSNTFIAHVQMPYQNAAFIAALVNWFRDNQAALNARAGGDDSARLTLLLDNQYMTQKLSDTGQWVLLDGQGYLVVSGHYDTARAAIDAALASQAVGVKS